MQDWNRQQRKSFPLRMPSAIRALAIEIARFDGISLNQFITEAIAEKITRLECSVSSKEVEPKPSPS